MRSMISCNSMGNLGLGLLVSGRSLCGFFAGRVGHHTYIAVTPHVREVMVVCTVFLKCVSSSLDQLSIRFRSQSFKAGHLY